jgi:hypothetical protein
VLADVITLTWFAGALFVAGAIEAQLWRLPALAPLDRPIAARAFGPNKRWRGLVTLPLAHVASVALFRAVEPLVPWAGALTLSFARVPWCACALAVGFAFNAAELPNSYVKRRLGIPPGDESRPLFALFDHVDSTYGALAVLVLFGLPLRTAAVGLLVAPALFYVATHARRRMGLKAPRPA